MNIVRDNIVPFLVGAVLTGIGSLALSIYTDFLPDLIPALGSVAPAIYVKVSLLLLLLLLLTAAIALSIFLKAKPYRPRAMSGKKFGFSWSAELDYSKKKNGVEIELQWLCPKHKIQLGIKSAQVPETLYHHLWCRQCDKTYEMRSQGDVVYVEQARNLVEREILGKLRFE